MVVVATSAADRYAKLLEALRLTDALVLNSQLSVQNKKDITGTLEFIVDRQNRDTIEKALAENADVFNRTNDRSQDTQGTVDTKGRFERLAAAGLTTTIFFYVAINLMMVMGLAPVVGIPLPLFSYGGSAMMTVMLCLGMLMSIDRNNRREKRRL